MEKIDFCKMALAVLETEASALNTMSARLNRDFDRACETLLQCQGRIVVIGMGKSGHIAAKCAATLASTGSPAFYVHPGEASHGDMGMITKNDVVLAISYSGQTEEIIMLLPLLKRLGVPMISITGNPDSALAKCAKVNLDVHVEQEACPLGLAPTASTTCSLAMGDALAISLLQARGFTADDFALSHPGGSLGKRLLLRIDDIMSEGEAIPKVSRTTSISAALVEMTSKQFGMTTVIDDNYRLCGIFTDGDLRRALDHEINVHHTPIAEVMTIDCKTITKGLLAAEALNIMEQHRISTLIVVDHVEHPIGIIHMHDLLQAGVV